MRKSVKCRLLNKINKCSDGHWYWTGAISNGYGSIRIAGKAIGAHRASYEEFKGKIPAGLHLDHLCKIKLCVNPDHLEPVHRDENTRRGDHTVIKPHMIVDLLIEYRAKKNPTELAKRYKTTKRNVLYLCNTKYGERNLNEETEI